MKKNTLIKNITIVLFLLPWIVGFLFLYLQPLINSMYYSLCDYNVISKPEFVGFKNYINLFTNDDVFIKALSNTLYMIFIGLSIDTVFTIFIAILLSDKRIKGASFYRVVFYLPTLIPLVISSILWIWILNPDTGIVNGIFRFFNLRGPGWFSSPFWAKPGFILMLIWGSGKAIIILLAGINNIPITYYEAAQLDGAGYWQKHLHITVPVLRPVIIFNILTSLIAIFQSFAESLIITNGGPNGATIFYSLFLYKNAFQYFKMGYASAMSCIMLVIAMLFVVILFRKPKGEK